MKKRKNNKLLYRTLCAVLAVIIICQTNVLNVFSLEEHDYSESATLSLKDELSKNGNLVTEYENAEDNQLKTILWTQGITPPRMGGNDSQFKRQVTYDKNGNPAYVDYVSRYLPNQGWYDVNKSTNFEQNDVNLCFAAAAANSLHWWMDRNAAYIERYLEKNPNNDRIQKLTELRTSFSDQQHSGVYNIFRNQFAGKPDGYWSDLLQDQFLNGYYLNSSGGTNDSDTARDKLLKDGPDKHGGFFYEAFSIDRLTQRRYYDIGFDALNRELKDLLLNGNLVLMTYTVGYRAHVVTVWGVEFDPDGNICAVYYTDSDDEASQGMLRYRLVNIGGKPAVTTRTDGKSTNFVTCLQILSPGTELWNRYFQDSVTVLDLNWSNTNLTYNGKEQAPTVTASNVAPNDNITLTVKGGAVNAGHYTATAEISGPDADKYRLPTEPTCSFEIKKAPAPLIDYPSAGGLQYGQKLSDSMLLGGSTEYGNFLWADTSIIPDVNNHGYFVNFVPSETTKQNYEGLNNYSQSVAVNVSKANPTVTLNAKISAEEESNSIILTASLSPVGYGKLPSGTVTFTVFDENGTVAVNLTDVEIVNGTATATWSGAESRTYTVKAVYSGSNNYNSLASPALTVDVKKRPQVDFQIRPIDTKTYGDESFELSTLGGSGTGAVTYESSDPDIISIAGNTAIIHKAGTVTITATKAGDALYNEATATFSVVVGKRELKVIAHDKLNVVQGDAMPELTYTVEGLVKGDQFTDAKLTVSVEDTSMPGDYPIVVQGGTLTNAENYNITYVNGNLSIQEKEQPPAPTEPSEPSEPTNPTEPTEPTEPSEPTDPTEPSVPSKPTEPSEPSEPTEPSKPSKPQVDDKPSEDEPAEKPVTPTERPEETSPSEDQPSADSETEDLAENETTKPTDSVANAEVSEEHGIHTGVIIAIGVTVPLIIGIVIIALILKKK